MLAIYIIQMIHYETCVFSHILLSSYLYSTSPITPIVLACALIIIGGIESDSSVLSLALPSK